MRGRSTGGVPRWLFYVAVAASWLFGAEIVVLTAARRSLPGRLPTTAGWLFVGAVAISVIAITRLEMMARQRTGDLLGQLEEALGSITALTEASLSSLELGDLLDRFLDRLVSVLHADIGVIFLIDETRTRLSSVASRGVDSELAETLQITVADSDGLIGRVVVTELPIATTTAAELFVLSERSGHHLASAAACPILIEGRLIGVCVAATETVKTFNEREMHLLQLVADRSGLGIERRRLDEAEQRAKLESERARRDAVVLATASASLSDARSDYEPSLTQLVDVIVPGFSDWCAIDLVNSVGSAARLAIRHLNDSGELCSADLQRRLPLLGAMIARAIDSGSTQLSPGVQAATSPRRRNPDAHPIFDPTPWIIVPIATGKGVCGAITFVFDTSEATVNPQLTITAEDIARRAAIAIDRVLFYKEAQEVAEHSRQIANQLQQLLGASLQVARLVDRAEVLRVIARRATAICNAAGAIISVTASDGESIRAIAELDEEVRIGGPELRPFTIDLTGELTLADSSSLPVRTLITPITGSDGGSIGSLVIWRTEGANFTKEDETVLVLLAQTASTSLSSTEMYQTIQSSEARWRTLVEAAPIGIIEVDTRGAVLWANHSAAAIFGGLTEHKLGLNAPRLAASSHLSSLELLWSRAITGAAVHDRELLAVEIGGELRDLLVSVVPLYDSNNSVEGILTLASDISERRRLEEDLQQAQRMEAVGQLAGNVAHDFNNLLTLISGYTELLRSIDLMDEKALGLVESIQGVTDRAAMLTGRLLTISRSQSARAQTFDLIEAIGAKIEVLGTILGEEVHLVHEIPKERGYVSMDPAYFDQMILNLAVNARDAMPEGGVFTISIQRRRVGQVEATRLGVRHGEMYELILSDTGIGMDAATEARCFEPFFTTKGPTKGTGLGLAAVRSVIVESGGSIEVHSAPGNGTSFVILLPATSPPIPPAIEVPVSTIAARENHEMSVLVAEDDEGLRSMITKVISQAGFQVHSAPAGDLALDLARSLENKPQLLVTDVAMPGLNGPELARYVLEFSPATAVLFISSNTGGIAVPPSRAGHVSFLAKPFRPSDLLDRIYEILDARTEQPLE